MELETAHIETRLVAQPLIPVPTITIDGDADGVNSGTAHHAAMFTGPRRRRVFKGAGHNPPQNKSPNGWRPCSMRTQWPVRLEFAEAPQQRF